MLRRLAGRGEQAGVAAWDPGDDDDVGDEEEADAAESMLAQCEFTMEKSVQVHAMNLHEQDNYQKLTREIGTGILFLCV